MKLKDLAVSIVRNETCMLLQGAIVLGGTDIGKGMTVKSKEITEESHRSLSSLRLLTIMETLAEKRQSVRLVDLARELGMTQSTTLRYLTALCDTGYVRQDPQNSTYVLTWKLCGLGSKIKQNISLEAVVHDYLSEASARLNANLLFAVVDGANVHYVDKVHLPDSGLRGMYRIGIDAPLHSTSSGKVLLSGWTYSQVVALVSEHGLSRLTPNTITDKDDLLNELSQVRARGYAIDDEECEIGHRCVAVPVYDYSGTVYAAISAFGNAEDLNDDRIQELLPDLFGLAKNVSFRLGYQPEV